jgi:hypothetical protein
MRQHDVERAKDLLLAQGYRGWEQHPSSLQGVYEKRGFSEVFTPRLQP